MDNDLSQLMPASEYQEARCHVFPSEASLEWFIRLHKPQLIERRALLLLARKHMVDAPTFDQCVKEFGARAAAERGNRHKAAA